MLIIPHKAQEGKGAKATPTEVGKLRIPMIVVFGIERMKKGELDTVVTVKNSA